MPKAHMIMRNLPEGTCRTREGQKETLKIADEVEHVVSPKECFDENQWNPLSNEQIDAKWVAKNKGKITWHLEEGIRKHSEILVEGQGNPDWST